MSQARGVKKSTNTEPGKRRTPYALRACEACRRRKGKCDGRQPCRHCASRNQNCSYSGSLETNDDWQPPAATESVPVPVSIPAPAAPSITVSDPIPPTNAPRPHQTDQNAIVDMLSSLQAQLNSLAAQVNSNNHDVTNLPSPVTVIENARAVINRFDAESANSNDDTASTPRSSKTVTSQNFYGPTCPDYALNVGQLKLRHSLHQRQVQLASIHEDDDSDEEDAESQNRQFSMSPHAIDKGDPAMLLTFRSVIGLQEAIQLLYIYQEVVGELHPVVDIDALVVQTRSWYSDAGAGVWDVMAASTGAEAYELLLIMNLCLAIALRADAKVGSINTETLLRDSFQDAVNAKLAAPANSIKHATIIFLKGWYDFFQDMPRSAWRMCGIAGRMLMELGLHNAEVFKHTVKSEAQRTEACTLVSSIVILDRQWSYATGLPIHFHETSFSSISTSSVKNPYLKAMLSFILISDRFSEPISRAAKGEGYNDESSFELMTFQIEQWRKKAVGEYSIAQCHTWQTDPSTRPPTWAILLNLRAESVRSQLLKPFFFSELDIEITKKHVRSATERVYDIINVLHTLDATTDIYRKQHPCYQHILACTSGLAFLLMAFIKQNRSTMIPSLTPDLVESLGGSFSMAVSLTTKYTNRSRSARRLAKRLIEMRRNLLSLGILNAASPGNHEGLDGVTESVRRASLAQTVYASGYNEYSPPFNTNAVFGNGIGMTGVDTDMQMGWDDSMRLQWPLGDVNHMFSESMF
ncbi:activator of stress 1 [Fusarium longipes]|uniref:Activator of stress 1 n=1 Tax=Fusarium longipes TaxID=694270 RepID=A0A395RMM5_9HYPO|nr:activator of stress 1 [Fusarium longipes]